MFILLIDSVEFLNYFFMNIWKNRFNGFSLGDDYDEFRTDKNVYTCIF